MYMAPLSLLFVLLLSLFPARALACANFVTDYGAVADDVTDNTPAWNTAMADQLECLYIPGRSAPKPAAYIFLTPPDPVSSGMKIIGDGPVQTMLRRVGWSRGAPLIRIRGENGTILRDLTIQAGCGTTGSHGLDIRANNTLTDAPVGFMHIENVAINGHNPAGCPAAGTFYWPLFIRGSDTARLNGWRANTIRDMRIFNGEQGSAWISGAKSLSMTVNTYRGSGGAPATIYITGTRTMISNNVYISGHVEGGVEAGPNVFNLTTRLY